jgi:hypothetical protein
MADPMASNTSTPLPPVMPPRSADDSYPVVLQPV